VRRALSEVYARLREPSRCLAIDREVDARAGVLLGALKQCEECAGRGAVVAERGAWRRAPVLVPCRACHAE
jgi:hypothetical protein